MTQPTHPLAIQSNFKLKDLILEILAQSYSILTLDEILLGIKKSKIPHTVDKKIIRRLINKLTKKGLVEYVYIDLSYGVRMVNYHSSSNSLEAAT